MDIARIVDAILAGPLPREPYVAALPMYDWPERRAEVDGEWAALRNALRARGVDAPERLARRNADLPTFDGSSVDLAPDKFDLAALWQHPNLLFAQTCHGPLQLWLKGVRIIGQEDYGGVEGGEGELYSSALVMRADVFARSHSTAPPSVLSDISPTGGEIGAPPLAANFPTFLAGLRLAYSAEDSCLSGYMALEQELEARNAGMDIFSNLVASGGHRNSIRMVAQGEADVAAIDCKSWALAQRFEPAARELVVVSWTARRKGLPFITGLPFKLE